VLHYPAPTPRTGHSPIFRASSNDELALRAARAADGAFVCGYKGRLIDFRVPIMPTIHGGMLCCAGWIRGR